MINHISELKIESYRGLRNLEISNLAAINILVGENNCGKTSVLEAIQILNDPSSFDNLLSISRQRDRYRMAPLRTISPFDSFLNIFPKCSEDLKMEIKGKILENNVKVTLKGTIGKQLLDAEALHQIQRRYDNLPIDEEVENFSGYFESFNRTFDDDKAPSVRQEINYNKYETNRITSLNRSAICKIKFLSTVDHVISNSFGKISSNKKLTSEVVSLLKIFDNNINDLRLIENENGRVYEAIENTELGLMPISTYGDGIRKVIALAGAIAMARGGILLIDEIETGIHTKAMNDVFEFIEMASQEYKVQIFATTHSLEALEKLLNSNENRLNNTRVITLYKNENRTVARVLDGGQAIKVKDELGLELR